MINRLILSLVAVLALVGCDQRTETRAQQPALDRDRNGAQVVTAIPVTAESTRETDVVVFVTSSGRKYHREDCHFATGATAIPLSRAESAYEPCKICKPDVPRPTRYLIKTNPPLSCHAAFVLSIQNHDSSATEVITKAIAENNRRLSLGSFVPKLPVKRPFSVNITLASMFASPVVAKDRL